MSLSEGIIRACNFFNLKVPENINFPSDFFCENLKLDLDFLRCTTKLSEEKFSQLYNKFTKKYSEQTFLKQNSTDMNIYFCDYLLHARKNSATIEDYFDFDFYKKNFAEQKTFRLQVHRKQTRIICNDFRACELLDNKVMTLKIFSEFVHRDWLDSTTCSIEEFKNFIAKHPNFFIKPIVGSLGKDAAIVQIDINADIEKLFDIIKERNCIIEEIITQHESISEFCPDTLNTIRVNTLTDIHGVVHIMTTGGRFGRVGKVVDNFFSGGFFVAIDTETGKIISDAANKFHESSETHPDTNKIFKGFQYPAWNKICAAVKKMAKIIPQLNNIGWDIAINADCEVELVEANSNPDVHVMQTPENIGKLHLYQPFINEWENYKYRQMKFLGYKINNLKDFKSAYESYAVKQAESKILFDKLISNCASVIDVGCRKDNFIKTFCAEHIKYIPIDLNEDFSDIKADACICAMIAEFTENLPQFLKNLCNAADKQILMLCRPIDKEINLNYRWKNPVLTDFTEEFLINTMQKNNFRLQSLETLQNNLSLIIYEFIKNRI